MNSFDSDWMSRSGWRGLLDWIADAWAAPRERGRAEQFVAAALVLAVVVGIVGAIHSATVPTVAYEGPTRPRGWKPLYTEDGRPKPNRHACGSMTWGIDVRGAPYRGFERDAVKAARIIARASGIPLNSRGRLSPDEHDNVNVVIGWAGRRVVYEPAIGVAWTTGGGGSIYLLRSYDNDPGFDGGWGSVMLHEWGHIIGLDHVRDPSSVMNGDGLGERLNAGDRRGLRALGRGSCR